MEMNINTLVLINVAYLMTFIALSVKEVLWLRLILVCSHSMIFINNYHYTQSYNVAFWNLVFIMVNLIQVIRIYDDRKPRLIPEDVKDLYEDIFKEFSSKEFLYFMQLGQKETVQNKKIISLGDHQYDLLLVLNGKALVKRQKLHITDLIRGQFIGEISFLTDQPASADVYCKEELSYIKWDQSKIKAIKDSNISFWIKLNSILTNDITLKITK